MSPSSLRYAVGMSKRVALIDPLAVIDGRRVFFLRDTFGGEVPLSCPYPPLELAYAAALLRDDEGTASPASAAVSELPEWEV